MRFLGIDNGASGGIAALNADGTVYAVEKMPATEADLVAHLIALAAGERAFAVLEHAQAFPGMGVSGVFAYGRGYGAVRAALHAARIPFDVVVPRKWQAAMGCLTRGDKNVSKRRAQQLFPGATITHFLADALLIAEYCRRIEGSRQLVTTGGHDGTQDHEGGGERQARRRRAGAHSWRGETAGADDHGRGGGWGGRPRSAGAGTAVGSAALSRSVG